MSRMLSKEGRVYAGVFLIPPKRLEAPTGEAVRTKFPYVKDGYFLASEKYPDLEVAYDPEFLARMAERCGLTLDGPIRWGKWPGTEGYRPLDIVLLKRMA
jgi:hypothetical protein